jgi:hypothetical protein
MGLASLQRGKPWLRNANEVTRLATQVVEIWERIAAYPTLDHRSKPAILGAF